MSCSLPCRDTNFNQAELPPFVHFLEQQLAKLSGIVSLVPEWKKMLMPEQVWYKNQVTQSSTVILQY
jgi:hypothetical protein